MEIASGVVQYIPSGRTGGLGFLTEPSGQQATLHVQRDWRHPESRFRVASEVSSWYTVDFLGQGRFTYARQFDDNGSRLLIADNERGTTCLLPIRPDLPSNRWSGVGFLPSLGALTWNEPDPANEKSRVTFLARPQDCGDVRVLGQGLQFLVLAEVGSRGLVFASAQADDAKVWSLFYVPSYDGGPLDTSGKLILPDAERRTMGVVGARREALVMGTTGEGPSAEGLYLFGPLPPIPSVYRDLP
jgi:hypothetical protein